MKKQAIEISVVVTVYNLQQYLEDCLESILRQQGVIFEVICVDDASSDNSCSILKQYADRDARIRVVRNNKNLGLSSARNVGFRMAKGEYLYNIDGDDMLAEGALKRMYECAKSNNLDLLAFAATAFFENDNLRKYGGSENEYVRKKEYPGIKKGYMLFTELMENDDRVASNMVLYCFKRTYFIENNLYGVEGLRYADDSMFALYMAAERAMCISDRLYLRRYREGSMVTSSLQKRYMESMIVLYVSEMMIWRTLGRECIENIRVQHQIKRYFNMRYRSILTLKWKFKDDSTAMDFLREHPMEEYFYNYFIEKKLLAESYFSADDMDKIKNAAQIVVFGAGAIANLVMELFDYYNIVNYSIAVTDVNKNPKIFHGRSVIGISEAKEEITDALVIVAVSKKDQESIKELLYKSGYSDLCFVKY